MQKRGSTYIEKKVDNKNKKGKNKIYKSKIFCCRNWKNLIGCFQWLITVLRCWCSPNHVGLLVCSCINYNYIKLLASQVGLNWKNVSQSFYGYNYVTYNTNKYYLEKNIQKCTWQRTNNKLNTNKLNSLWNQEPPFTWWLVEVEVDTLPSFVPHAQHSDELANSILNASH